MMQTRAEVISLLGSVGLLTLIFELVRTKRLKEKYSLIWLVAGLFLLALSIFKGFLDTLGYLMGIYYSPSAFFLLAFLFLMLITVQFSVVLSKHSERNKILTQELALLRFKVDELEKNTGGSPG